MKSIERPKTMNHVSDKLYLSIHCRSNVKPPNRK